MSQRQTVLSANCPECNATIDLTDPLLGELVTCQECASDLEVRSIAPLKLAAAPKVQEDWGE